MNNLVSICMATYNGEKYLAKQLDSILSQTYKNVEIIICDDKSDDNTSKILENYSSLNPNITFFINEKKLGVTKNFEKSISKSKGEFILLCDQDDIWLPNKIEHLIKEIGSASLIYSNACFINGDDEKIRTTMKEYYRLYGLDSSNENLYKYLLTNSFILGCAMLFRKDIVEKYISNFPISSKNHDWFISLCANEANGIKYIDEILFMYRIHSSNYSMSAKKISTYSKIVKYFSNQRKEKRKNLKNEQKSILEYFNKNKFFKKENSYKFFLYFKNLHQVNISRRAIFLLKNRKYILPYEKGLIRILHILSKV